MNELGKSSFLRSLPEVLRNDKRVSALAEIIADALTVTVSDTELVAIYPNIDEMPEDVLDALAYDFKVDWYDYSYSLEEKRATIKDSWNVHRKLGTKYAVETAISAVYPNTKVEEWFEYGGEPYFFRLKIDLTGVLPNPEGHERVMKRLAYYKNLRSHIDEIQYVIRPDREEPVHVGGCMASHVRLPVVEIADKFRLEDTVRFGGAASVHIRTPVPELRDAPRFRGSIRAGGRAASITTVPVPEINS